MPGDPHHPFDRVRVMWADHLGLPRGKYIAARNRSRPTGFCVTTYAMSYDRDLVPAPGGHLLTGLKDIEATVDESTLRPGWEDNRTGIALVDLSMDGAPYPVSARNALKRAIADWKAAGYDIRVGLELEGYILEPTFADDGRHEPNGWQRFQNPRSMVYGTGPLGDPSGLLDEIWWTADRCGFTVESMNIEFDESQVELTLEHDDALRAVDDAFLFRVLVREVAIHHGLDFTFLGRPFPQLSGSGVHVNFSLVDRDGNNAMSDPTMPNGLSTLGRHCIAGLVHHHRGLAALCAPTINAYRRLRPASLSGVWANWGVDHRNAANRIPAHATDAMRIESRLGDGSMNLYTGVAAVLQAARLGTLEQLDPGPPLITDGFEDGGTTSVRCADNLADALADLEADTALTAAVGQELVDNFLFNKGVEVERFEGDIAGDQLTEFERTMYLPYH